MRAALVGRRRRPQASVCPAHGAADPSIESRSVFEGTPFLSDRLPVLPQYVFPKQALTSFAGWVAGKDRGAVTTWIIRRFVAKYGVDMAEALDSDIASYPSFNAFFTRALKPGARPLARGRPGVARSTARSASSARSRATRSSRPRATATPPPRWSAATPRWPARFQHGSFATLYLSPRDYHRIHMPCDGRLPRMIYVPGELFSVNPTTARGVPGLFARNERVVCVFDTAHGPFVLVLVGATIVGSMATVWHGVVNPPRGGDVREWHYEDQQIAAAPGRGDGPLPARLDRRDAVPGAAAGLQSGLVADPAGAPRRGHGELRRRLTPSREPQQACVRSYKTCSMQSSGL